MKTFPCNLTWPDDLPLPVDSFSGAPVDPVLYGGDARNRTRYRKRFTQSYGSMGVMWCFPDPDQYSSFKDFFQVVLFNGADLFKMSLRFPKNSELQDWAVRFASDYSPSYDNGVWSVQATLDLVSPINLT